MANAINAAAVPNAKNISRSPTYHAGNMLAGCKFIHDKNNREFCVLKDGKKYPVIRA